MCTLKTAYTKIIQKNVKRLEIGKDIRGVILTDMLNIRQVTNQINIKPILIQC